MDQKTWLWKKRISEKPKVSDGKTDISLKENGELLQNEKEVALQESLEILNEKLASVISDCNAKDELVAEHMKKTEEALAGKGKAEAEVLHLKEELNEALRERAAENGRIVHLNTALKDCMQQLNSAREEQEQKVQAAIMTTSKELATMNKRLTNLTVENSHLNKALIERDILIKELSKFKTQAQAEFNVLIARLDSTEKENTLLRYEFRMLEKELDIRNEDRKYTRYSLDASHKQYLESVKKIKKLEAECQRLRVLVRKRLPGPASLAKMTREVQSGYQTQTRKMNSMTGGLIVRDSAMEPFPDNPGKDFNYLVERLREVHEENKVLREVLVSRLGSSGYETCIESRLLSCGSSVSSSLSEREQFKHGDINNNSESKTLGIPDMSLMDDFVEMEKLAIVAVNSSNVSGPLISSSTTSDITSKCRELVLTGQNDFNGNDHEHQTRDLSTQSDYDWLQRVLKVILEQNHVSGRSLDELLEEIGEALHKTEHPKPEKVPISGFITWKSPVASPRASSNEGSLEDGIFVKKAMNEVLQSNLGKSTRKIIELVRRSIPIFPGESTLRSEPSTREGQQPTEAVDYTIHVFRWKSSELSAVLQQFIDTCNNLLDGKVNFEKLFGELASTLSWIIESRVDREETSSVRDELGKLLNQDESGAQTDPVFTEKLMIQMKEYEGFELGDSQACLQAEKDRNMALTNELQQSKQSIGTLQAELQMLRESKRMIEDQIDNLKSINEDLDTQLTVAKAKISEVFQKLSSVEVELEHKSHCCEELEGTCLELQLQLESISYEDTQKDNRDQEDKVVHTGWEITAAPAKLDECQDTTLKLGQQLKAMASSKETPTTDIVLSTSCININKKLNHRLSLLDRMQSEDSTEEAEDTKPPTTKETALKHEVDTENVGALAIIPSKKRGGGVSFLKKLLLRKKNRSRKKPSFYLTT